MRRTRITLVLLAGLLVAATPLSARQFPPATKEAEAKLLAVLKSDDASREAKSSACRDLAVVGTETSVPVLAALLGDEALSHMARYALEPMPYPSVDEALREALGQMKGRPLVGVVGSVGVRQDGKAVPLVTPLLESDRADVAHAAARALGSIGTPEAAKALQAALGGKVSETQRQALAEGLLRAAEALDEAGKSAAAAAVYDHLRGLKEAAHQVRTAAVRGAILSRGKEGLPLLKQYLASEDYLLFAAACRTSHEMAGGEVTRALVQALGKGSADRQALVLLTLGRRKDAAALPAVLAKAKADDAEKTVRLQAIRAAAEITDPAAADALADLAGHGDADIAQAARESLAAIPGEKADEAVMEMFRSEDAGLRRVAADLIRRRGMRGAVPDLLNAARAEDPDIRAAALKQVGELAGTDRLPALLDLLLKETEPQVLNAAEAAIGSVCARAERPETCAAPVAGLLPKAKPVQKATLLKVLGGIGGEKALKAVRSAVGDADENVHTTAIRTLAGWKTPDVLPVLLEVAEETDSPRDRTLALRGYLGWASRSGQDRLPGGRRLEICRDAANLVKTPGQKKLLLGALGRIRSPETINLILPHLDDADVRNEACSAVLAVAKELLKVGGGKKHAAALVGPLEKVAEVAKGDLAGRAKNLLKRARSKAK